MNEFALPLVDELREAPRAAVEHLRALRTTCRDRAELVVVLELLGVGYQLIGDEAGAVHAAEDLAALAGTFLAELRLAVVYHRYARWDSALAAYDKVTRQATPWFLERLDDNVARCRAKQPSVSFELARVLCTQPESDELYLANVIEDAKSAHRCLSFGQAKMPWSSAIKMALEQLERGDDSPWGGADRIRTDV